MADADPIFDRAIAYEADDGTVHYRASSLGYCMGALVRARMGLTPSAPPDVMLERYQEGHDWEARVLEAGLGEEWRQVTMPSALARFGQVVDNRGSLQIETELTWGNKVVTCHPDAIVQNVASGELRVCEVKFLGPDMYADITRNGIGYDTAYAWQASIEMLSTRLPMLYIVGQKEMEEGPSGERRVMGISDTLVMLTDDPYHSMQDIKIRVAQIEGYVARGEFPPCPVPFDYPCGYWDTHEKVAKEPLTDDKLALLVESYQRAVDAKERHEVEMAAIKGEITDRLIEIHADGGVCGGWEMAFTQPRKGNVSWSKAYKELAKVSGMAVDEDAYRGAEVAGGLRMSKVKES